MKQRGMESPDRVDAALLTVYEPVASFVCCGFWLTFRVHAE